MKNNKNLFEQNSKGALIRIFLSSFLVITFFYIVPIFINFADKNFNLKEYSNSSQKILAYTLNKKDKTETEVLKEEEILFDIFSLNNLESDSVRLSASTIKELFDETGYNLIDVRKNKLVKPVALTLLPHEIKNIENVKKRKELFIQIVLTINYSRK
jgi:Bax protein